MDPFALAPVHGSAGNLLAPLTLSQRIQAERARRDLHEFCRQAWAVVEPTTPFVDGWHIRAICEHLEAVSRGDIRELLINIPPRHMKSLIVSVFWPMWVWCTQPHIRWLCSSYALQLAIRDNRKARVLIESDWYRQRWGNMFSLARDQNAKMRFENSSQGYRMAVSTESAATGEGGDHIIVDDPHSVRDANSDLKREDTLLWWATTMQSRLNDQKKGGKIIVMQRVDAMDLSGFVLEQGGYTHLCLPAEFVPEKKCFTDIGWEDPRTQPGELLWPEQVPQKELDKLKRAMGAQAYAAQFQQNPVAAGGNIFKQDWLHYFSVENQFYVLKGANSTRKVLRTACSIFATVDLAISKSTTADYTVISTWAVTPQNDLLLLEVLRDRWDSGEIEQQVKSCYARWHHSYLKIESVAFQLAMCQQLARAGVPVQSYKPAKDKVSRAISASTFYANEQVFHLQFAPYLTDVEPEMLAFPKGEHDDCVDTISMACESIFTETVPNIRTFDDDNNFADNLLAQMERGSDFWGDF